jgi:hypothetical protein
MVDRLITHDQKCQIECALEIAYPQTSPSIMRKAGEPKGVNFTGRCNGRMIMQVERGNGKSWLKHPLAAINARKDLCDLAGEIGLCLPGRHK